MLKLNEKGFTLVEALVTVLILSSILSVAATTVVVTMKTSRQNTECTVNLRQVENAGNWISSDALMSQEVDINKSGVFLNLRWSDWDGNSYEVDYLITEDHMLMRQFNGGTATLIAEYIDPLESACDWDQEENKLTVTLRATARDVNNSYERVYEICPRPVARGG